MLFSALIVAVSAALSVKAAIPGTQEFSSVHVPGTVPFNKYEPLQHRLAFYGSTGMSISWTTFAALEVPQVWVSDSLWDVANNKFVYNGTASQHVDGMRTYSNHVRVTGLKPDTLYWYKVSYTNCYGCATLPTYSFKTAKAAGDHTPFSIGTVVDLGLMGRDGLSSTSAGALGPNDTNTIQSMYALTDSVEFWTQPGDFAYADYVVKEHIAGYFGTNKSEIIPTNEEIAEEYEIFNEEFYDELQPITARKAYMVGPGNHEANCDNGGTTDKTNNITYTVLNCPTAQRNFSYYGNHWDMKADLSGGVDNFWYSFDYGMAHFVFLDTETDQGNGLLGGIQNKNATLSSGDFGATQNAQVDWLSADLKKVDRKLTPWVVVMLHRPWYVAQSGSQFNNSRTAFEKILYDNEVDLYVNGHIHVYERNKPMYNYTIDPNGLNNPRAPWNIINGAGGHYDGLDTLDKSLPVYVEKTITGTYGWSRFTFRSANELVHDFISSTNNSVLDTSILWKDHKF